MLSQNRARKASPLSQSVVSSRKGKQGRPMKRSRDLAPSRQEVKRRQQTLHMASQAKFQTHQSSRKLSAFEQLPTEIIQHIFFLSLEGNLAVTSQTLNTTLSDESIFRTLLLFAFFQPDGLSPVEKTHFFPAEYRHLDTSEREQLQRTIFGFKWCNRRRIDSCMPTLCRLAMVQAWHRERDNAQGLQTLARPGLHIESRSLPKPDLAVALSEKQYTELERLPDINDEIAMRAHYFAQEPKGKGDSGAEGISPWIRTWYPCPEEVRAKKNTTEPCKYIASSAPVLAAQFIPDKILRGSPWTDENHSLLRLLMQGLLCTAGSNKFFANANAESVLFRGMESAILQNQLGVLESLLEVNRHFARRSPGHPHLPTTLLRAALELGSHASIYLEALLRSDVELNGEDDEDLTAWALEARKMGNPLGKWLLQALEAPPHQRPRYDPRPQFAE